MIAGIFHQGSGIGNQLHRYVATRVLALDKGYEWGMIAPHLFKGYSFMHLNTGKVIDLPIGIDPETGKTVVVPSWPLWNEKTNYYNPEFNFIEDRTILDGEFQSIQYFGHRLDEVSEWLNVEPLDMDYETCVIGFRGGEYAIFPELFLPKEYWDDAIEIMKSKGIKKFQVQTDDEPLARQFFKDIEIIHDIGINWRSMRFAKYAIVANSSFFILPRLLSGGITIAPRLWARHNLHNGVWSRPDNYYSAFQYL